MGACVMRPAWHTHGLWLDVVRIDLVCWLAVGPEPLWVAFVMVMPKSVNPVRDKRFW